MDAKAAKVPTGWLTIMSILGPACAARAHQVVDRWQGGPALGWQPSRFLADRGEAERAFALAERLGSVNAATHLGTAWACPPATPKPSTSALSPRPAAAPAGRPPRPWARCLLRSILAPSPPTVSGRAVPVGPPRGAVRHLGRQRGGRAVQRESRPQTTTGPRRSSDEPTAATGWPANAPTAPTAATPTEPTESTAPAGPTNPRSGRWWPMSAEPTGPHQRAASGSTLVVYLDVLGS
jgi:hypothetical protein